MINQLANSSGAIIKETIERLRKDKTIFIDRNKVVFKNNEVVPFEEREKILQSSNYETVIKAMAEEADYYSKSLKEIDTFDVAKELPVLSYEGTWYYNGKAIDYKQQVELVRKFNPKFELPQIQTTIKTANIIKAVDKIPPFKITKAKPKDNGFRFNKIAYQLLHYYLFEPKQKYIVFLMSEGGKGKSTFTNLLRQIFKNEYYSADSGSSNQFFASFCAGKRLVCFSDCTSNYIENMHILKQISGNDEVSIERKGEQAYSGTIDAHLLFVGNEPLSYDILDSGNQQRFVNLPWENDFKGKKNPKWAEYIWSDEEIAFQIELARNIDPIDFEKYRKDTIKTSLRYRQELNYDTYDDYESSGKMKRYNIENFHRFWKLVSKFYTFDEIKDIRKVNEENKNLKVSTYFGEDLEECDVDINEVF